MVSARAKRIDTESPSALELHIGLLAVQHELVNLAELRHCLEKSRELTAKRGSRVTLADALVQLRYLSPQDLSYLVMIVEGSAEPLDPEITLADIEEAFERQLAELEPGALFGPYQILEELGRGGMGIVFRCFDTDEEEEVALKILIGGDQASVEETERFKKEVAVMLPLQHPSIVKTKKVGRTNGLDYIAMEVIQGRNLRTVVEEEGPLDPARALGIIRSVAEAVQFIHGHRILHRDIKPENVVLRDDGSAVLMDFGLAGWGKIEVAARGGSIGTPMYQPPEQAQVGGPFGKISEASDVYGLGATLYYLLTGQHPFRGKTAREIREKILTGPPRSPRALRPELPELVSVLCLLCLNKRQAERFAGPKELIDAIDEALTVIDPEGKSVLPRIVGAPSPGKTSTPRSSSGLRRSPTSSVSPTKSSGRVPVAEPLSRKRPRSSARLRISSIAALLQAEAPPPPVADNPGRRIAGVIVLVALLLTLLWIGFSVVLKV